MRIIGEVYGDAEVVARFDRIGARLRPELKVGITRATLIVQRQTKLNKLSGQVLKVITGRLRRSINTRVTETGDAVEGTVGTNVEYAPPHEFGFHGLVTVLEHLRRTKSGVMASVRGHSRMVNLPERSFLRSSLADKKDEIRAELMAATHRAVHT